MTTLEEIIEAFRAIDAAERHYRELLRVGLDHGGVRQADVVRALGRSREQVRQDAMTDAEREHVRAADADRKRRQRDLAAAQTRS